MTPILEARGLASGYGAGLVLRGVDLAIRPGEAIGLMGRNGMGKTTLFKSLMGVLPLKSGQIEVAGQDVSRDESYRRVAKGIAYVPQGRMIFPTLTVEENIQTGLENAKHRRIPEEIYALFPVLWDMRRRKGGNLSGGQQQQLAIARALTARPRLLILDEPTEGIQPSVIKDIARVVRHLARERNMAVVLVEQYYEFARDLADRIAVMVRGEVALGGPVGGLDDEAVRRLLTV